MFKVVLILTFTYGSVKDTVYVRLRGGVPRSYKINRIVSCLDGRGFK